MWIHVKSDKIFCSNSNFHVAAVCNTYECFCCSYSCRIYPWINVVARTSSSNETTPIDACLPPSPIPPSSQPHNSNGFLTTTTHSPPIPSVSPSSPSLSLRSPTLQIPLPAHSPPAKPSCGDSDVLSPMDYVNTTPYPLNYAYPYHGYRCPPPINIPYPHMNGNMPPPLPRYGMPSWCPHIQCRCPLTTTGVVCTNGHLGHYGPLIGCHHHLSIRNQGTSLMTSIPTYRRST